LIDAPAANKKTKVNFCKKHNWLKVCTCLSAADSTTYYLGGTQRSATDKLCNGRKVEDQQDDLQQHGLLPVNCQAYRVVSHRTVSRRKRQNFRKRVTQSFWSKGYKSYDSRAA